MKEMLFPAATAVNLAADVDYVSGSIVSKTLVNSEAVTMTLFAFDAGQGLSEHSAPFDALLQVMEGSLDLKIGSEEVHAECGEMVLMPAKVPHSLRAGEKYKIFLIMIRE